MSTQRHISHDDGPAGTTVPPRAHERGAHAGTAKIKEAVQARDALADALLRAGVQLPAMDVRTPWQDVVDGDSAEDVDCGRAARYALVHLGVCSAPVAFALAAVINKGAGR
ncbi:hypothetical protein ACFPA8_01690 [Streptomyces ovatisporus]|uniref:Uncharacterized protein n=1 Tax=Streptomyces ovatisporus TaxID=1128682 RepID=A0ABV8ZYT1_9ACTN